MHEAEMIYWALQEFLKPLILIVCVSAKSTIMGITALTLSQGREADCATGILDTSITTGSAQISLHKIVGRWIFQMG